MWRSGNLDFLSNCPLMLPAPPIDGARRMRSLYAFKGIAYIKFVNLHLKKMLLSYTSLYLLSMGGRQPRACLEEYETLHLKMPTPDCTKLDGAVCTLIP